MRALCIVCCLLLWPCLANAAGTDPATAQQWRHPDDPPPEKRRYEAEIIDVLPGHYGLLVPKGEVQLRNAQSETTRLVVFADLGGDELHSDAHALTDAMIAQLQTALDKGARPQQGTAKTIDLRVLYLGASKRQGRWWGSMTWEATLGNGELISRTEEVSTEFLMRALHLTFAAASVNLLNHPTVRDYLTEGGPADRPTRSVAGVKDAETLSPQNSRIN